MQEKEFVCCIMKLINKILIKAIYQKTGVSTPKGEWKPEDVATVGELLLDMSIQLART